MPAPSTPLITTSRKKPVNLESSVKPLTERKLLYIWGQAMRARKEKLYVKFD